MKIFYSWQSDLPNSNNRNFIQDCIDKTVKKYKSGIKIEADRDTQNETGSPDITNTIFDKINDSDLFVADISIINSSKCSFFRKPIKPTPNPNVLIELGYAARELGWNRIICLYNTDYADLDALPFDLRQHRITTYSTKDKAKEKKRIVEIFSETIDALMKDGCMDRIKGVNAYHRLMGYDNLKKSAVPQIILSGLNISEIQQYQTELCREKVEFINSSNIIPVTTNVEFAEAFGELVELNNAIKGISAIDIKQEERQEVIGAVRALMGMELQDSAFYFGGLREQRNYLFGNTSLEGTDQEKEKYDAYLQMKRLLSQICIFRLFSKSFENVYMIPLVLKNVSKALDKNIKITVKIRGSNWEPVIPNMSLFDSDLQENLGFVCEYGFIPDLFHMEDNHEISFDEGLEVCDYFDENPYINLWDNGTKYEAEDCQEVFNDFVATPNSLDVYEFKINSLQANEAKWLDKVILIKKGTEDITVEYSIKSDNTDGSVGGVIEM